MAEKLSHTTNRFTGIYFYIVVRVFICSLLSTVLRELVLQECDVIWKLRTDVRVVHAKRQFFPLWNLW